MSGSCVSMRTAVGVYSFDIEMMAVTVYGMNSRLQIFLLCSIHADAQPLHCVWRL